MSFTLKVLSLAIDDIQNVYDWYESKQTGLGEKFLVFIDLAFQELTVNPFYQVKYGNMRCRLVHKFPYMIHYSIDENKRIVFVAAVLGTRMSENHRRSI